MQADTAQDAAAAAKKPDKVGVSISTTSGFFPDEGFDEVPAGQEVEKQLDKAKAHLKIKDTAGWVATVTTPVGKKTVDPKKSYEANGLSGQQVEIDWGPSEGGGG